MRRAPTAQMGMKTNGNGIFAGIMRAAAQTTRHHNQEVDWNDLLGVTLGEQAWNDW